MSYHKIAKILSVNVEKKSTATMILFKFICELNQFKSKRRIDCTPHIDGVISIVLLLEVARLLEVMLYVLLWCEVWINGVSCSFTNTCFCTLLRLFVCISQILILTVFPAVSLNAHLFYFHMLDV